MTEQTNTPELRFPEFREEWESKEFKDIIKVNSGKDYKHLDIGKYPVYGTGGYMLSVSDYLYKNDAIGIGRKGTINKPYLLVGPFWTVDTLFYCTPLANNNLSFLLNLFRKINWKKYDESTGVPSLSKMTISKIKCKVPIISEQEKIGNFFSKLDQQIELEEKKLELLEQQKRGYMQKIFSQELRFKDDNGNSYPQWTLKNFKEVFEVVPSKKYQIKSSEVEDNANIPVVDQGQNLILGYSKNKEKIFKDFKNVIIYGDHTTFVKKLDKPFIIGGDGVKLLTSKTGNDINYLYNVLQYFNVKPEGYKRHFSILKTKSLYIATSIEEQKRIATLFNKIDKYIEKQFKKVELLKQRKQGLLQKMFI
ncbi:restriction endonuclease subunit S [Staphylococcus epidermidis]|uniref:restriction endonuclease subunit S n=1 Tax=Staphylococcus epidermidis TaxID=1282 RepID=UPI001248EC86|nr:restriction endonuclease subunit S [Staphylococcus epidermidis]KAA9272592.1 restriction endonuclease subunit S [Staphylococcus epidermidis]MDH8913592.1 restriction endonuclease subunit S [Staphylococcus epidermidis]MDH8941605.1 restriction endonuclease subunit S [Staphylococcus epidermidis]MDH9661444.1 restriction endonuclease subunit S [Staphylococcus epidermidis]MDH9674110.1 restriction endonuclease subunit S [Staphylococcus epidermidis]